MALVKRGGGLMVAWNRRGTRRWLLARGRLGWRLGLGCCTRLGLAVEGGLVLLALRSPRCSRPSCREEVAWGCLVLFLGVHVSVQLLGGLNVSRDGRRVDQALVSAADAVHGGRPVWAPRRCTRRVALSSCGATPLLVSGCARPFRGGAAPGGALGCAVPGGGGSALGAPGGALGCAVPGGGGSALGAPWAGRRRHFRSVPKKGLRSS